MLEIIVLTIVIIVAFIAASWYAHQRSQERARAFERELDIDESREGESFQQRFDALFEQESHLDEAESENSEQLTVHPETDLFTEAAPETAQANAEPEASEAQDWDMVIALTIMAPAANAFTGRAVKAVLDNHDLHFGDMQIYHRQTQGSRKQTLFSVANILDPGTLLPDKFVSMTTPGLLVFARLPGPINGMALFDDLLETARGMNEQLGGVLCDDQRQPISDSGLEAMRARILDYQMSVQAENNQHSNDYFN